MGIRKIAPQKIAPYENNPPSSPMNIPSYENPSLWKLPPRNLPPRRFLPGKITLNEIPPTYKSYKWKKQQNYKIFCLEESSAIQHPCIMGLDSFFTEWKKSKNRTKAQIVKWHLLASCTSQGELKLGSQIIKFSKYVKLLNRQLSIHITLWILKKANSKMHASGRVLSMSVDVSTEYFTNMPDRDESEGACCIFMASYVLFCSNISQGGTKYQPFF